MGGRGSGRHSVRNRETVSGYLRLDVRRWQRDGLLLAGSSFTWQWTRAGQVIGSINVRIEPGNSVILSDVIRENEVAQRNSLYLVSIVWTPCNYGGQRAWFLCPARGCGRRVAVLHGDLVFLCRGCRQLKYDSQRASARDRALRRAEGIRRHLGGSGSVDEPLPPKPKAMHWQTYERLRRKEAEANEYYQSALQSCGTQSR